MASESISKLQSRYMYFDLLLAMPWISKYFTPASTDSNINDEYYYLHSLIKEKKMKAMETEMIRMKADIKRPRHVPYFLL